jgi:hypothetical protein
MFDPQGRDGCWLDGVQVSCCLQTESKRLGRRSSFDPDPLRTLDDDDCGDDDGGSGSNGGGVSGPPEWLQITNFVTTGGKYNSVINTLDDISADIDPNCLAYLQSGGGNLSSYISGLVGNNLIGVGDFSINRIAAITGTAGTNLPAGTAAMVVNSSGAFFYGNYTVDQGKITGGTAKAQVFILLHELGHALGAAGFLSDAGNPANGKTNDQTIATQCANTLSQFSGTGSH